MGHLQYNPNRLKLARQRRRMTYKALSEHISMSSKMVSSYEKEGNHYIPTEETIRKIAHVLKYPVGFFYGDDIEALDKDTVSFRSLKSMKAAQMHAALAAGQVGFLLAGFFSERFSLPEANLPDFRGFVPELAAEEIRDLWMLGNKSIPNVIHLLESKGIRVFSLSENNSDVDAFSFWKDGTPYVFLNTQKSAERSRFDAAHELGHLLLHRHGQPTGRDVEQEADAFASSFLMPKSSVIATAPRYVSLDGLISLKKNWLVSVMAVIVRFKHLELITEWQYRSLMVEASQAGYRTQEPSGIGRERSLVADKILPMLKQDGVDIPTIAEKLNLPVEEVSNLLFRPAVIARNSSPTASSRPKTSLRLVK